MATKGKAVQRLCGGKRGEGEAQAIETLQRQSKGTRGNGKALVRLAKARKGGAKRARGAKELLRNERQWEGYVRESGAVRKGKALERKGTAENGMQRQ